MDVQILDDAKVLLDATKIESFDGNNFKRWQQKVLVILDFIKISSAINEPRLEEESKELTNWELASNLCINTILNALSNELFDVYCNFTIAKNL